MSGPLQGIKVLDLSWVLSGPFSTMILSDLGAEVIKLERPGWGDMARGNGPFLDGESSYFLSINRGKKSIAVDLTKDQGKALFVKLAKKVDVLVENFTPGTMKRLGLDYEALKPHNPALIYAAISGFGQSGPYASKPALDVIVQAMGGIMSITGEQGGPPVRPGASLGDIAAGLFTAIGVLSALHERSRSGLGQMVDISMLDCQVAVLENAFARYFATGEVPQPLGTRHPVFTPFQAFATSDGYVVVALVGGASNQWALFCSAIDRPDLIDDKRFESGWLRTQHYTEVEPMISAEMRKKTTSQWLEELSALDIPCGPVNRIDQVASDPQVNSRQMFKDVSHPRLGKVKVVNSPLKLSRTPPEIERSAPALAEDTRQVLKELLGLGQAEIDSLSKAGIIQTDAAQPAT